MHPRLGKHEGKEKDYEGQHFGEKVRKKNIAIRIYQHCE